MNDDETTEEFQQMMFHQEAWEEEKLQELRLDNMARLEKLKHDERINNMGALLVLAVLIGIWVLILIGVIGFYGWVT